MWGFSEQVAAWSIAAVHAWDTTQLFKWELLGRELLMAQSVKLRVVQAGSSKREANSDKMGPSEHKLKGSTQDSGWKMEAGKAQQES